MSKPKQAPTILVSSAKTSPTSAVPLHAAKVLVDVDDASVSYGAERVLDNVSFCIHEGDFIGLIGPNGAGKTTLLKAVLGLMPPTTGQVRRRVSSVGYIPQRGALYAGQVPMSVAEVVRLGVRSARAGTDVQTALEQVGMQDYAARRFTELSGGQQQRVAIAKALAGHAQLLILDEPTTGIDEGSQKAFYRLLKKLQAQGITIVMVSHEVDAVLDLVTRVICLNRSVLYDGPAEHFEEDKYLPKLYAAQHVQLHHQHDPHGRPKDKDV
jgi:zinc transport system ATP-binding protein